MIFATRFAANPFDLSDLTAIGVDRLFRILAAIYLLLEKLVLIPAECFFACGA
jgi:hypothetical protein